MVLVKGFHTGFVQTINTGLDVFSISLSVILG